MTTTETTNQYVGPFFYVWDFSTVTIGPSPAGATLQISYGDYEQGGCQSNFLLDDHRGGTLTGNASDPGCSSDMVGQITAATGQYEPDVGKTVTLTVQLTPTGESVLESCNNGACQETGVFAMTGALSVK